MDKQDYYQNLIDDSGMEIISCSKCGIERIMEFQVDYRNSNYFTKCHICGILVCDDCFENLEEDEDWVNIGDRDYQCKKCEEEYYNKHPKKSLKPFKPFKPLKNDLEKETWYPE